MSVFDLAGAWTSSSVNVPTTPLMETPQPTFVENAYTGRPKFNWIPIANTLNYTIEINDVCGDSSAIYSVTTAANGPTPLDAGVYHWRVLRLPAPCPMANISGACAQRMPLAISAPESRDPSLSPRRKSNTPQ